MLSKIKVYGRLARFLGQRTFEAEINSTLDAIKFLTANFPNLQSHMIEQNYCVKVGGYQINNKEIDVPVGLQEIKIVPVAVGSKGIGKFISGLCHNLSLSNIELNKLDLKQLLFNVIHPNLRSVSLTPLTVLQTTYLIGSKVDMFVSHRDLNNFLQINFNTSFHENKGSLVLKKKVKDYIEENKNFKKALDKYLQIDYFVYQQILNNNQFWYWQLGRVLKYET